MSDPVATSDSRRAVAEGPRNAAFFYGWVMAPIAMLLAMGTMPGQSVGVAAFNTSLRAELQLSASQFAGVYALGTILASLLLPLAGAAMDRIGIRRTLMFILPAFCGACFYMSSVRGLVGLFVAFLLLRFLGQGALSLCSQNTLAMWFDRRLGAVAGITSTLVTLFMAASPLFLRSAIEQFGWRTTYQGLGVAVVVVLAPLLLLFRNRPWDIGQMPDGEFSHGEDAGKQTDDDHFEERIASKLVTSGDRLAPSLVGMKLSEAVRHRSYWILVGIAIIWSMVGTSLIFEVQALGGTMLAADVAVTPWGVWPVEAANTFFFVSVGMMNFVGGFLADRFSLARLMVLAMIGMLGGLVVLLACHGLTFFVAYGIYGLSQGLLGAVNNTIWPRYFGRAHLGKIRGGAMMAMVFGSSLGPLIMGLAYDETGSYQLPLVVYAVFTAMGLVGVCFLRPPTPSSDTSSP